MIKYERQQAGAGDRHHHHYYRATCCRQLVAIIYHRKIAPEWRLSFILPSRQLAKECDPDSLKHAKQLIEERVRGTLRGVIKDGRRW